MQGARILAANKDDVRQVAAALGLRKYVKEGGGVELRVVVTVRSREICIQNDEAGPERRNEALGPGEGSCDLALIIAIRESGCEPLCNRRLILDNKQIHELPP